MGKRLVLFFLLFLKSFGAFAETSEDIFVPAVQINAFSDLGEQSVREYFSEGSEFNYFEDQSFGSSQSLFIDGVDQRYLKIKYNGFELKDPSAPLGALDLSLISKLGGVGLQKINGEGLNLLSKRSKKGVFSGGVSSLGEVEFGITKSVCEKESCLDLGFSAAHIGKYNQSLMGNEKDSSDEMVLSLSKSLVRDNFKNTTYLLYSGKSADYDALQIDDERSRFINSFLFVGNDFEFLKAYKIKLGYTNIYRKFLDPNFKSRGENIDLTLKYKELLEVFSFREKEKQSFDFGGGLKLKYKDLAQASYTYTDLRRGFFDVYLSYKKWTIFYKEVPESLFQASYKSFSLNSVEELSLQRALGVKHLKSYRFKNSLWELSGLYQRAFDQIEYNPLKDSYQNISKTSNLHLKAKLVYKFLDVYLQYQRAKNLSSDKDLPRRSRWSAGVKQEFVKLKFRPTLSFSWQSGRRSYTGEKLSSFITTSFSVSYKNFVLKVNNFLNQDEQVFQGTRRRPFRIELLKSYYF